MSMAAEPGDNVVVNAHNTPEGGFQVYRCSSSGWEKERSREREREKTQLPLKLMRCLSAYLSALVSHICSVTHA